MNGPLASLGGKGSCVHFQLCGLLAVAYGNSHILPLGFNLLSLRRGISLANHKRLFKVNNQWSFSSTDEDIIKGFLSVPCNRIICGSKLALF